MYALAGVVARISCEYRKQKPATVRPTCLYCWPELPVAGARQVEEKTNWPKCLVD